MELIADSEEQKQFFSRNPEEYLAYRKAVERDLIPTFDTVSNYIWLITQRYADLLLTSYGQCIKGTKEQVAWAEVRITSNS